ncbi:hypothetical protein [Streptomyces coelicolor A3(2)]|jgi:hypothetical protein|uniref:Uncharacterized protein n=2 Tax=Streptomyces TaxID=1883 RepID=Q9ACQ4_STRCO|nr:hypothetical protein [Streptomyces coelicolor A3(2)]
MVQHIAMPCEDEVPPGPRRDLLQALHALYEDAGYPGLRTLAAEISSNKDDRLLGCPNREGIAGLLRGSFTTAPVWANLQALVRVLAAWSHRRPDPDEEESRFHTLWRSAAQPENTPHSEADAWADDPALYQRELPYQLQGRRVSVPALTAWHDEQRDEKSRRALPAIALQALWTDQPQAFPQVLRLMGLLHEEHKPLLARIICNAGAFSELHYSWPAALEEAGRHEDAGRVRDLSRQHRPPAACWAEGGQLVNSNSRYLGGQHVGWQLQRDHVWQYFVDMTVHRPPGRLASFLTSLPYRNYSSSDNKLAQVFHAAVATEYEPVALAELLDQLHEDGAHLLAAELWNCAARGRRPLVPLLQALRDAGRNWEGIAILRRTMASPGRRPAQQPSMLEAAPLFRETEQVPPLHHSEQADLLDELLEAGLVEEADTLAHLRLLALHVGHEARLPQGPAGSWFGYS